MILATALLSIALGALKDKFEHACLALLTFSRRLTGRNESLRDWAFHPAVVCTSARKLLQLSERGKTILNCFALSFWLLEYLRRRTCSFSAIFALSEFIHVTATTSLMMINKNSNYFFLKKGCRASLCLLKTGKKEVNSFPVDSHSRIRRFWVAGRQPRSSFCPKNFPCVNLLKCIHSGKYIFIRASKLAWKFLLFELVLYFQNLFYSKKWFETVSFWRIEFFLRKTDNRQELPRANPDFKESR